ncbi:hypothetical protein LAZ40_01410 [Cereibacter sphaeroides]|uniref:hypothetical protein n=1 Tax=Cereibacter sphaeroides TaxID=1063 RepID=UPI001F3CF80D|nr:hypothetical protein [Cereibacter sphaeroides]MCE6957717.1 hypothetical protein [Cereibacter sphaeroides]MCE6971503.1 hypothetical protein [Cereibacter sphaeroides]
MSRPFSPASDPAATTPMASGDGRIPRLELADGRLFNPFQPDPDAIAPELVAIGLGNCCRFGGQIPEFYSVAQHSVLVALLAPRDLPAQRMALLHDAEEGFGLPDLPTPFKPRLPAYVEAQAQITRAVEIRFGLDPADHPRIKPADLGALALEKVRLKTDANPDYWREWVGEIEIVDWVRIVPLGPLEARELWLEAFDRVFRQELPVSRDWIVSRTGFVVEPGPQPGF